MRVKIRLSPTVYFPDTGAVKASCSWEVSVKTPGSSITGRGSDFASAMAEFENYLDEELKNNPMDFTE